MQAPICENCARSGVLCLECKKKLKGNRITKTDIELAGLLCKMEDNEIIKNPSFERTIEVNDILLVLTRGDAATLIGKRGRVVRQLSKSLNKTVRIIKIGDFKTQMIDLLTPARLLGINVVYRPEGEETQVVIPKEDEPKLIADTKTIEKAARLLFGKETIKLKLK